MLVAIPTAMPKEPFISSWGTAVRKHRRLHQAVVVIGLEVHRFFLDVGQHLLGDGSHSGFRITHRRRRIAVYRTPIPLPVHQGITHQKILRHPNHGVIDRHIAVRMIFSESVADNGVDFKNFAE